MKVYTYSRARQRLASLLDEAFREGSVQIRRRDGTVFELLPLEVSKSALEVPGVATDITASEIVSVVRASRSRVIGKSLPLKRMRQPSRARRRTSRRVRAGAAPRRCAAVGGEVADAPLAPPPKNPRPSGAVHPR